MQRKTKAHNNSREEGDGKRSRGIKIKSTASAGAKSEYECVRGRAIVCVSVDAREYFDETVLHKA